MRAWLALIPVLALVATPVAAQGKAKAVTPPAVVALEMCELFLSDGSAAMARAEAMDWHILESNVRNPYQHSFMGAGQVEGLGGLGLYAFVTDFPAGVHSSCQVVVNKPQGDGHAHIQDIQSLERYEGTSQQVWNGSFASLSGREDKRQMLLLEATNDGFMIQLYVVTPKTEEGA